MEDLPPEISGSSTSEFGGLVANALPVQTIPDEINGKTLREALEGPEREIILQALRLHNWNRAATADALDINRTTLYKKMKRLGLDDPRLQFA
jgi:DNA-binding NtrC family response regulator